MVMAANRILVVAVAVVLIGSALAVTGVIDADALLLGIGGR